MGLSELIRLWHTLRPLKPVQVYGRAWQRWHRPRLAPSPAPAVAAPLPRPVPWIARPQSQLGPSTFRYLNDTATLAWPDGWNDPRQAKLWLYNLHYFEDLTAADAKARSDWHHALIARWIADNPPGNGNGWEPYPTSLRIVSWIKWALAGARLDQAARDSLAMQVRWLERRLEWHLLGNHLLANAKALVFAGLFFDGPEAERWRCKGLDILARELPEQILSDGGHFERSPMYHAIILEDVLDLLNAAGCRPADFSVATLARWRAWAERMLAWLAAMTHPDGGIAFFNDAAFGIAATPAELAAYAARLDIAPAAPRTAGVCDLRPSGYVRVDAGAIAALLDCAPIGPDYLPGHAHADTLSFELSLGRQRMIVNGGTSLYGLGPERERQRGTAAHSTVQIDDADSSEVWAGFRVARRARVRGLTVTESSGRISIAAEHDGYRRLAGRPLHRREWHIADAALQVIDHIAGGYGAAVARYHLHPAVEADMAAGGRAGILRSDSGAMAWESSAPAQLVPSTWHPEFGRSIASRCLVVPVIDGTAQVSFRTCA